MAEDAVEEAVEGAVDDAVEGVVSENRDVVLGFDAAWGFAPADPNCAFTASRGPMARPCWSTRGRCR